MKHEIKEINTNIEEIGTGLESMVTESAIPVVTTVAGLGWSGFRYGTEGIAGILDMVFSKASGGT